MSKVSSGIDCNYHISGRFFFNECGLVRNLVRRVH